MDNWSNPNIEASERRLLIKNAILGFKSLSWEMRKSKDKPLTNLSLLVLLFLKDKESVLRSDIMIALKSNYHDIEKALQLLRINAYILIEENIETRINNSIRVKSKRFRLSLSGDLFTSSLIEMLS